MFKRLTVFFWIVMWCVGAAVVLHAAEDPILVIDPQGHSSIIRDVMFTPDGRRLISVGEDKTIRIWDVASGEVVETLRGQMGEGPEGKLFAGVLSPDGRTLAVGGYPFGAGLKGHPIQLINLDTRTQMGVLTGHDNVINALDFSADGKWLASGSADDTVRIWDVTQANGAGAPTKLEGHTAYVCGVAWSPDGSMVVSASLDHTLRLWKKNSQGRFATTASVVMKKHDQEVYCVAWSPDGKFIVSGGIDDKILLWDAAGNFKKEIAQYSGDVYTVSFSQDSQKVVVCGTGNFEAVVYAIPAGTKISSFTRHNSTVVASAFFGKNLIATAGGDDYDIYLWDADTGTVQKLLLGKGKSVWATAFGQGLQVAFGQSKSYVDYTNWGPLEKTFDFSKMALDSATPLATGFCWSRASHLGNTLKRLNDFELQVSPSVTIKHNQSAYDSIRCYTFTNEGHVVVGSAYYLNLYDNTGQRIREFVGHTGEVWAVSVSQDGHILASASYDQTVKLWNIHSGQLLATLFVTTDNEWICWTPQGYYAASAGGEKYIGWQVNQGVDKLAQFYPAYSFRKKYNNPELVSRTIELFSFEKALAEYNANTPRKIEVAATPPSLPPTVLWLNPVTFDVKTNSNTFRLQAQITATEKIVDYKILVNGSPIASKGQITVLPGATDTDKTIEYTLPLLPNENRITIFAAHSRANVTTTPRVVFYESMDHLKPNLYVLSIGIADYQKRELKLEYADDDALEFSQLLETQKGRLFKTVTVKTCVDKTATRDSILDGLAWLDKNATQKDVVMVFISAHGCEEREKYYILPHDVDTENLLKTGVRIDDFLAVLGNLSARSIMFLDSCQSGGIDIDIGGRPKGSAIDNTEAIRELSSPENGVVVMAASTGKELSLERAEWGHGAFTKVILDGMKDGKADYSNDGIIHIDELKIYVYEEVQKLTNGKQHPNTQIPDTISRFPVFQLKSRE